MKHNDHLPPLHPNSVPMAPNYIKTNSKGVVENFDPQPRHFLNPEPAPYTGRNIGRQ